jgi:hypothetical protein
MVRHRVNGISGTIAIGVVRNRVDMSMPEATISIRDFTSGGLNLRYDVLAGGDSEV